MPSLIKVYRECSSMDSRNAVVESLGWIGPAASPAVQMLLEAAGNTNNQLRASAVWTLGEIHASPGLCVPELLRALHDADGWVQLSAAHALGNYGKEARSAVPVLEALTLGGGASAKLGVDMQLTLEARRALGKIDPKSGPATFELWPEPGFRGVETPLGPR